MEIREVLQLEANAASIKKIDAFLANLNPNHRDYPRALAHLAYLTFSLGDTSSSFKLLFNYLEICLDKEKPTIYNTLIKLYYAQQDYDNVLSMIEMKKNYLPSYNKVAYYEDLILYYHNIGDSSELIRNILTYLSDDITDEKRLKALVRVCKEYLKIEDYDRFNEKNKLILSLAITLNEDKIYREALYNEAFTATKVGSYPKALKLVDDILEIHLDKEMKGLVLALKLEILVALGEYRKASIFEAEYEYEVNMSTLDAKINFARSCIILYEALNNRFNKNNYEEQLALLLEEKEKLSVVPKSKKSKVHKQKIELNFIKNDPQIYQQKDQQSPQKVDIIHRDGVTVVESGSKLLDIANEFSKLNSQVFSQFRDYLRQFFIVLSKLCIFDEAYMLTKTNKYHGYYYKKERLYDKKSEQINLADTILLDVMDLADEVIIANTINTTYVDIITNKLYYELENMSVISLPLTNGCVMFTSKKKELLTANLNYETLKMAVSFLELKWNSEQNEIYLLEKHHDYSFILEHIISGYKKQIDNYVYLSKEAAQMFDSYEAISIMEFYNFLVVEDSFNYKKIINDLLTGKVKEATIQYRSDRNGKIRHYQEDFKVENDTILSVINDITENVKTLEDNIYMAHFDPITNTFNKMKLINDLAVIAKEKASLLALDVKGFKMYGDIYGYEFAEELTFAIGKYLKSYDETYSIYHFDSDKFIVAIKNINDKRTVSKIAKELTNYLTHELKKLNYRLNIYFKVGILRLPTDTTEHDPHILINYLLSALSNANDREFETTIGLYDKDLYKKKFIESQLITHISEAIDNNHLALNYQQVVDASKNICDHYYVKPNLCNYSVDSNTIYEVLEKRKMVKLIERYMIHKALFELEEIYKETHLYLNFSFIVSKETLLDETFKDYLLEQLKFYHIPKTAITICYNGEASKEVCDVIKSLVTNQILISSTNIDLLKQFPLYYYYYKLPTDIKVVENDFIIYLKEYSLKRNINFVLDNVNNKELIAHFANEGISLYSGKVYSALLTKNEIVKSFLS